MLKDRGTIKWTALMLPEHVKLLREWNKEDDYQLPKEKSEWELEELQQTIQYAASAKKPLSLSIWNNQYWVYEQGIITALDRSKGALLLETNTVVKRVPVNFIYDAKLLDEYND